MVKTLKPLTDAELKARISRANYFRRGEHFIALTCQIGQVPTIVYNPLNPSTEWKQWYEYFARHLGWVPVVMQKMLDRAPDAPLAMTVPSLLPQSFDLNFISNPNWRPPDPRLVTPKEHRETLAQLHNRFGPGYGIKQFKEAPRKEKPYKSLTDDELRAMYGPQNA